MNVDELTEAVWEKLHAGRPRALLIGEAPKSLQNYNYVKEPPYETVIIGLLPPGDLLQMPSNAVCEALLDGMPVWYWPHQSYKGCSRAGVLRRALMAAEQRLKHLGVQVMGEQGKLVTAAEARQMRQNGLLRTDRPMTPLAKDILEGRES